MPAGADAACTLSTSQKPEDGSSTEKACNDALKIELQFLHQVRFKPCANCMSLCGSLFRSRVTV